MNDRIKSLYPEKSPSEISKILGVSAGSVRNRIYRMKLKPTYTPISEEEALKIKVFYESFSVKKKGMLDLFCKELGRPKTTVSRHARQLGLTDHRRKGIRVDRRKFKTSEERWAAHSENAKRRIAGKGHPKGMAGKHHSAETKMKLSNIGKKRWAEMDPAEAEEFHTRRHKARFMKYGTLNHHPGGRGSWKAGWREIGPIKKYYRSRWEANYARYLEWLRTTGHIADWKHEPETFWFEAIRRGVRSYLPDFRVWENDGTSNLHEVKGWMDARSKTVLKRMAKYHPLEKIILIAEKDYNAIKRKMAGIIRDWE